MTPFEILTSNSQVGSQGPVASRRPSLTNNSAIIGCRNDRFAKSSHSPKLPFTIKPDAEHGGRWPSALDALR
jgi:hypothetical protein